MNRPRAFRAAFAVACLGLIEPSLFARTAVANTPWATSDGWRTEIIPAAADTVPAPPTAPPVTKGKKPKDGPHALSGIASFYWQDQMTASGEVFDKTALTAAHRTLPFGTEVRVTRTDTGQSVVVRINDRGPFKPGRVIDLSKRAAEHIEMTARGLVPVEIEVIGRRKASAVN